MIEDIYGDICVAREGEVLCSRCRGAASIEYGQPRGSRLTETELTGTTDLSGAPDVRCAIFRQRSFRNNVCFV
jgi:hypothetical protein